MECAFKVILYPDLPRPREREISLFSVRHSEIWIPDYVQSWACNIRYQRMSITWLMVMIPVAEPMLKSLLPIKVNIKESPS